MFVYYQFKIYYERKTHHKIIKEFIKLQQLIRETFSGHRTAQVKLIQELVRLKKVHWLRKVDT